ncbi:hypothetical protein AJ78_07163 [Emergomyces pasteurianus Ep9510]|uniref:Uncharacterized protein n=1 Tax=Emergomyces pasteurianus Ep9510 TaxID=1447872 RepID=A0A1J9Q8E0_9EURO|nr:hypothetical protein AJ78_07163 [Emergomyces pasteurianus Ep9510]
MDGYMYCSKPEIFPLDQLDTGGQSLQPTPSSYNPGCYTIMRPLLQDYFLLEELRQITLSRPWQFKRQDMLVFLKITDVANELLELLSIPLTGECHQWVRGGRLTSKMVPTMSMKDTSLIDSKFPPPPEIWARPVLCDGQGIDKLNSPHSNPRPRSTLRRIPAVVMPFSRFEPSSCYAL